MSNVVVVDASLALKWVLPEDDSDIANMLLKQWTIDGKDVIAPALFTYETTNILYRQIVMGRLTYDETKQAQAKLFSLGVSLVFSPYQDISKRAMEFAHRFSLLAAYDAHYLALAERRNCEYWTADTHLLRALNGKLTWVRRLNDYQAPG